MPGAAPGGGAPLWPECHSPSAEQPVWTALGLSQEAFMRYLPAERMRLHREHHPQPPVQRRPVSRELDRRGARLDRGPPVA